MGKNVERNTWQGMKRRCHGLNPSNHDKERYQDRGIVVCDGWRNSFENFLSDMGTRPVDKTSIDRIDNDKNYSCGHCADCKRNGWEANCRWANAREQALNTTRTLKIVKNGKSTPVAEISKESRKNVWNRIRKLGWDPEKASSQKAVIGRNKSGEPELIKHDGKSLTRQQWSKLTGIPANRIYQRIHVEGWSIQRALTTPAKLGRNQFSK